LRLAKEIVSGSALLAGEVHSDGKDDDEINADDDEISAAIYTTARIFINRGHGSPFSQGNI